MMRLVLFLTFVTALAQAYIPNTRMILQRLVENSGTSSYQIEKEIRFANVEIPTLKEVWTLENEKTLKLVVYPVQNPQMKMTVLYVGGQKYIQQNGQREVTKIPAENIERPFHFRTTDNFVAYLNNHHILNTAAGNLDLARLNRGQGVVNWGLGKETEAGSSQTYPYIWIEQDRFVIRKLRFESNAELTADQFQNYPKGLYYPNVTNLSWGDQKVKLTTQSVSMKKFPANFFQASSLEDSQNFLVLMAKYSQVLEFYSRFR